MRGQRSPSRLTMSMHFNLGPPPAANAAHGLNDAEGRHTSCQVGEVTSRSSQLAPTRQNTAGHENLLSVAEEALRRQITHKTKRLYAEQGPDSSKAFLSGLCTLSTESFDQLWADILHASTSNPRPASCQRQSPGRPTRTRMESLKPRQKGHKFGKGSSKRFRHECHWRSNTAREPLLGTACDSTKSARVSRRLWKAKFRQVLEIEH